MIDGVRAITSSEAKNLSSKRLLSSLGIITLSLIEALFIYCFYRKEITNEEVTEIRTES